MSATTSVKLTEAEVLALQDAIEAAFMELRFRGCDDNHKMLKQLSAARSALLDARSRSAN
ncbi:hypothetical protein K0504_01070 [Neiella marina]|uniref:50S ribosomal protein L29 n=1 Tax=Neiella holothuriorum TaxID=2870530 RepID=A0ABS7ECQ5_9GAMM|nr:hypothetical protein [Neiella holothuriorum]MBW8189611.1 hypothetical protein [Neiella holothuriorum]